MFYKIIYNYTIIDVLDTPRWVIWTKTSHCFISTDETSANGLVSSDTSEVYHITGRPSFENYYIPYKSVTLVGITEAEYNSISSKIFRPRGGSPSSLKMTQQSKIEEMSDCCEKVITDGFSIILSDGISHHFSLELPDQIKISKLKERAEAGESSLPYHADDEPCRLFSPEDIIAIGAAMERTIDYQTTYFNSLKIYINALTDESDIVRIRYGMDIPTPYQSDILKAMLNQNNIGGGGNTGKL